MKFFLPALLALLATNAIAAPVLEINALATPSPQPRLRRSNIERRLEGRAAHLREIDLVEHAESLAEPAKPDAAEPLAATKTANYENWGGLVIETPPAGTFTAVCATFNVPLPTYVSDGSSGTQSASIWVGIDDDAILQTGIDVSITSSGTVFYDAWYEWYPAGDSDFPGISFSPGDSVFLQVVSSSPTTGTATIENLSTGIRVSKQLTGTRALQGVYAEWIVEDYDTKNGQVPLVDWNSVTFTNALAETSTNETVYAWDGPVVFNMVQNKTQQTATSGSQGTVTIKYVG